MLHVVAVARPALEDGVAGRAAGVVGHSSDILRGGAAEEQRRLDGHSHSVSGDEPTPMSRLYSASKVRGASCDASNSNEVDNSTTHTMSQQSSQSTIHGTHLVRSGLDSPGETVLLPATACATCEPDTQRGATDDHAAGTSGDGREGHAVRGRMSSKEDKDELPRGVAADKTAMADLRAARKSVVLAHAQLSPAGSDDESAVTRLPPSLVLRSERTLRALQHLATFGCCIFFFPTPVISWLFPLAGHVGLSNAEGTMLYTFESSYFVREERVAEVLSAVLPRASPQSPTRGSAPGDPTAVGRTSQHASRSGTFGAGHASECGSAALETSQTSLHSPSSNDVSTHSTSAGGGTASQAAAASSGVSSPTGRHARMSPNTAGATSHKRSVTGHAHCRCVCVWDLKPLLLKSYGRGAMRSHGSTGAGGGASQEMPSAGALWARLQGLLQGGGADDVSEGRGGDAAARRPPRDVLQVDKELARIYNQHLQDTVKVFRASADGSNNSPDVLLQHSNSFSFVGFVLEACELGRATRGAAQSTCQATATAGSSSSGATRVLSADEAQADGCGAATLATTTAPPSPPTASNDAVEEIHWGVPKVLFHIWRFGHWYRDERWSHYLLYGGNVAIAGALWCVLLAIGLHYVWLLLATRL